MSRFQFFFHRFDTLVVGAFLLSALFSGATYRMFKSLEDHSDRETMQSFVRFAEDEINQQISEYDKVLLGVDGLLKASESLTNEGWTAYLNAIRLQQDAPNFESFILVKPVKENFIVTHRFSRKDDPRALGLNIGTNHLGREAFERARDTGLATMSEIVQMGLSENDLPAFLYVHPIYAKNANPTTLESRRANIFAFAAFLVPVEKFFGPALARHQETVDVEILSDKGGEILRSHRLGGKADFHKVTQMNVGQKTFSFRWAKGAQFPSAGRLNAAIMTGCGFLFSLAMIALLIVFKKTGARAEKLVEERTRQAQQSDSKLENLVNSSIAGILIVDFDRKIKEVNPAFLEMTGYTREELLEGGITIDTLTPKEHLADSWISFEIIKNKGTVEQWEQEYIRKDGSRVSVLLGASAFRGDEELISVFALNLTERKKAEKIILDQQAQIAASAKMSALGELASGLAHEINNPLAIITMTLHSLKAAVTKETPDLERATLLIGKADATALRMSKIIKSLRSFARDASRDPLEATSVNTLLVDAYELCAAKFRASDVDLKLPLKVAPELVAHCRPVEVVQVLLNLLNNAHDAIRENSEKWVDVQIVEFDSRLQIRVVDSGPGIPDHIRQKIFEPFFTTKPAGVGTGLGLSISRGILEKNEGRLYIDAQASHTTFVIELPRYVAEKTKAA